MTSRERTGLESALRTKPGAQQLIQQARRGPFLQSRKAFHSRLARCAEFGGRQTFGIPLALPKRQAFPGFRTAAPFLAISNLRQSW